MKVNKNNNRKVVGHLALSSVRANKMRNFFTVFTIALSVSLLTVMSLYTLGYEKSQQRQAADMQHAIYQGVTEEQAKKAAGDERVNFVQLYKSGQGMEIKDGMMMPVYYAAETLTGDLKDIEQIRYKKGKAPQKINEAGVTEAYCSVSGISAEPGTELTIEFLDGSKEEFIISGIIDSTAKGSYPVTFSKEYAEHGTQLKDQSYDALVRIENAFQMSQDEFIDQLRDIADKAGLERKQVNENNYFVDVLSGGERQSQQTVTIIVVGIGILLVSVLVIYSVFYLSVIGRIRQFGQLRTIGMTKKQIRKMITKEGLMLCAMGIPFGLLVGFIIGYLLQKGGWDWMNTLMVAAVVAAADIITVMISIHKPAKLASTITPIEALKYSGYEEKTAVKNTKQLHRKITPMSLARMSAARNKKKTILTVISLGVGGVLFMLAATFVTSTSLSEYARMGEFKFGEFVVRMSYNAAETSEHGLADLQTEKPFSKSLKKQIEEIDGVTKIKSFERAEIHWEAKGEVSEDSVAGVGKKGLSDDMMEEGTFDYDRMMKNQEIMICGNEVVEEVFGWKFKIGDKVKLSAFNGTETIEKEYRVGGLIDSDYFAQNPAVDWFVLPEGELKSLTGGMDLTSSWAVETEKGMREKVEKELKTVLSGQPLLTMETLRELEEKTKDDFSLLFAAILGLSMFIIGFSLINLMNTLITNVVTRKQEFAMLQSIGMTEGQLTKMIQAEGLLLAAGNVVITLVLGIPLAIAGVEVLKYFGASYMHYTFPVWYFIGYLIIILVLPVFVSAGCIYSFKKQSLVERIRQND